MEPLSATEVAMWDTGDVDFEYPLLREAMGIALTWPDAEDLAFRMFREVQRLDTEGEITVTNNRRPTERGEVWDLTDEARAELRRRLRLL
ncbi:hypothetical protein ACFW53_02480 [Nocardiopsis dassonvillei]|uniref:hypothetical protein n=1 Tax=Nocardiopsis dassonvillei TaxID=2014 RepID=UPI00366B2DA8